MAAGNRENLKNFEIVEKGEMEWGEWVWGVVDRLVGVSIQICRGRPSSSSPAVLCILGLIVHGLTTGGL